MAFVTIENLKKSFGAMDVLTGIDLAIEEREFVVLVGPSGCGKSTLLRMIAGLEEVTAGDIHIDGRRVNDLEPRERDIAMVFQSYALYPHMTVRQNMAFNLKLRREAEMVVEEKVRHAAEILHLETLLDRYPRQLSGGQRQRVAMGRAIVRHPKVFLFDEPLSNLDAKLRVEMRTEIRKLHQSLGATSIYVTHDQVEAMTMADRIVVMNKGRIEQVGSPLDLYDDPVNLFVAQFIGSPSINLVSGVVEQRDGGMRLRLPNAGVLDFPAPAGLRAGQGVTVGFRPEHVRIDEAGPLRGAVSVIEHLGPETFIYLDIGGHEVCCRLPRTVSARVGDQLALGIEPEQRHLFDAQSGLSLRPSALERAGGGLAGAQYMGRSH